MAKIRLFPSLIAANPLALAEVITTLKPHCDGFHIDVMDNHFVPNLTWGPAMVNAISQASDAFLHIHLMVTNPISIIEQLKVRPGTVISIHSEGQENLKKIFRSITDIYAEPSIALSPKTPVATVVPWLADCKHVLLMSVEPGFSGQKFLPETMNKLQELVAYKEQHDELVIAVDGGINAQNIGQLARAGAEDFTVGSALFNAPEPVEMLKKLYAAAE
jgi:ribulose-phosphate 3-epimerase